MLTLVCILNCLQGAVPPPFGPAGAGFYPSGPPPYTGIPTPAQAAYPVGFHILYYSSNNLHFSFPSKITALQPLTILVSIASPKKWVLKLQQKLNHMIIQASFLFTLHVIVPFFWQLISSGDHFIIFGCQMETFKEVKFRSLLHHCFSAFLRNCINCVLNCKDHSSFDLIIY